VEVVTRVPLNAQSRVSAFGATTVVLSTVPAASAEVYTTGTTFTRAVWLTPCEMSVAAVVSLPST
jgi:hypothetical protein